MAKIIVEIIVGQKSLGNYKTFNSDTIVIGRGFDSDVIINDRFMSVQHLQISTDGEGLKIRDLDSKNGTYSLNTKQTINECSVNSGAEFILGQTHIRIYLNSHPLQPAKPLHHKNKTITALKKPTIAWILILTVMGLTIMEAILDSVSKEPFVTFLISPIITAIIIFLWAGFWAFIGRLIRHKARFFIYVSSVCILILISSLFTTVNSYIGFYTNSILAFTIIQYIIFGGLLITILNFSLTFSTNMRNKTRLIFSTVFTLLLISSAIGIKAAISASVSKYYVLESPYNAILKPPIWGVKKGVSIERFIENSEKLFKFDEKEME